MRKFSRYHLYFCVLSLLSCIFQEESKWTDRFKFNNNFEINFAQPSVSAPFDSLFYLQINWKTIDTTLSKKVTVALFSELGEIVLAKDIPDTGSLFVNLMDYRLPRKDWFRIKIYDAKDSMQYDYGSTFPLAASPKLRVYFENFPPAQSVRLDTTYEVVLDFPIIKKDPFAPSNNYYGWFFNKKRKVNVGPINENDSVFYLYVPNEVGSGADFRFCISKSAYPDGMGGCSNPFSIQSSHHGSFAVGDFHASETIDVGSLKTTLIQKIGNPGIPGFIGLYWDSLLVQRLAESIPDAVEDTFTLHWQPNARLMTSSKYRIGMESQSDPALGISFSEYFTIRGGLADTFEFDDTKEYARQIHVNSTTQKHTLPIGDADWSWFAGEAGKRYLLLMNQVWIHFQLPEDTESTVEAHSLSPRMLMLDVNKSQKVYLVAYGYPENAPTEYSMNLSEVGEGPLGIGKSLLAPIPGQTVTAGTTFNLTWQVDSLLLGNRVKLELFLDSSKVQTLTEGSPNTGLYTWSVDAGLQSSSQYHLRISTLNSEYLWGDGPEFIISGLAPDLFEPDNKYQTPSKIQVNAAPQARVLTVGDVDWVEFECANDGSRYEVRVESQFPVTLDLRAKLNDYASGSSPRLYNITGDGRCFIAIFAPGPTYGSYQLSVTDASPAVPMSDKN
jgi:Ser-Thr-rich glycosyl-phosphatidyl-inositol-anchored membrane family